MMEIKIHWSLRVAQRLPLRQVELSNVQHKT